MKNGDELIIVGIPLIVLGMTWVIVGSFFNIGEGYSFFISYLLVYILGYFLFLRKSKPDYILTYFFFSVAIPIFFITTQQTEIYFSKFVVPFVGIPLYFLLNYLYKNIKRLLKIR